MTQGKEELFKGLTAAGVPCGPVRELPEVIADPHQDCVLMHTRLEADSGMLAKLRLFALLAPHLEVGAGATTGTWCRRTGGRC